MIIVLCNRRALENNMDQNGQCIENMEQPIISNNINEINNENIIMNNLQTPTDINSYDNSYNNDEDVIYSNIGNIMNNVDTKNIVNSGNIQEYSLNRVNKLINYIFDWFGFTTLIIFCISIYYLIFSFVYDVYKGNPIIGMILITYLSMKFTKECYKIINK